MRQGLCIPMAPIYRPTEEEFANPMAYIKQIRPEAESFGICKIIPPPSFRPPFAHDYKALKFHTRLQSIHQLQEATGLDFNSPFCFSFVCSFQNYLTSVVHLSFMKMAVFFFVSSQALIVVEHLTWRNSKRWRTNSSASGLPNTGWFELNIFLVFFFICNRFIKKFDFLMMKSYRLLDNHLYFNFAVKR